MMARRGKRKRPQKKSSHNYRERPSNRLGVLSSFLIVCEGKKTEPNYFEGFRVPPTLVKMHVEGFGITPPQLVEEALTLKNEALDRRDQEEYDQVWCVFDKDDWDDDEFNEVIETAKTNGLKVAYSNQAFELWFLLHFQFFDTYMHRSQYAEILNEFLGRPYKKNARDMYVQLYSKQEFAIKNAEHLLSFHCPRDPAKANPSTTVHILVEELNRFLPENRKNTE